MDAASEQVEDAIITDAMAILKKRMRTPGVALSNPATVADYLKLKMFCLEHEVFNVLFLDVKNRLIVDEEMFRGTLTQTSVYPREVVKKACLHHNASAVVIAHNHPSGNPEPSEADRYLTGQLQQALALVDVRVLDHIITAGDSHYSFANMERYNMTNKTVPPDPDGQNDDRAEWAHAALSAFQNTTNTDDCDLVADLLADIMHWCDRHDTSFKDELNRARGMYRDETLGE